MTKSAQVSEFMKKNSPAILTGIGVAGVVSTAVLSAKAGYRHGVQNAVHGAPEDRKQAVKECYKHYIPTAAVGATTITAIIFSNTISSKRNAAIASLYTITDLAFKEYKDKIIETVGEKKHEEVLDEIASDRVAKDAPPPGNQVLIGKGEVLTYDSLTGRYFMCDMQDIRAAQNEINAQCINNNYASQNDFYRLIGLPPTTFGEEVGWTVNNKMDIHFTSVLSEDGRPCLVINYQVEPTRGFYKSFSW